MLLTIVHQVASPVHDAVALFSFQTRGLPAYANPEELALDRSEVRAHLVEFTRIRFAEPFLTLEAPPSKRTVSVAMAMDRILATTSLMAMIPDIVAPDAAAITVPVLLALGDGDLDDAPHAAPATYTGSSHVTLLVLRDTRHNHFLYASRTWLCDRLAAWIDAL